MKYQLMSRGLWLSTVILSLTSALATPAVSAVERHAKAYAATRAGSPLLPERAPAWSGWVDFRQ